MWTLENSNRVLLAFARGLGVKEAAVSIGVSVPTLRKHYSAEVEKRDAAALRFEAVQLSRLNDRAKAGSVAAEKELARRIDKARLELLAEKVAAPAPRSAPRGKKATQQAEAEEVRGLYEVPASPMMQ